MTPAECKTIKTLANEVANSIADRRKIMAEEAVLKDNLKHQLKPIYFKHNNSAEKSEDVQHTFDVGGLQVSFANSYFIRGGGQAQQIRDLLGPNHPLAKSIKDITLLVVDVSDLSNEKATKVARDIATLTVKHGISRPVVDRTAVAMPEFHDLRHVYLTPEDNMTVDEVLPMVVQVASI